MNGETLLSWAMFDSPKSMNTMLKTPENTKIQFKALKKKKNSDVEPNEAACVEKKKSVVSVNTTAPLTAVHLTHKCTAKQLTFNPPNPLVGCVVNGGDNLRFKQQFDRSKAAFCSISFYCCCSLSLCYLLLCSIVHSLDSFTSNRARKSVEQTNVYFGKSLFLSYLL